MRKMMTLMLISLSLVLGLTTKAQTVNEQPLMKYLEPNEGVTYYNSKNPIKIPTTIKTFKHQFRGVWVATVDNIDMNQQLSTSEEGISAYKQQFISILDTLEAYHMNTIIFQVRPANDAFYKSELNPWSEYLTGEQGLEPNWDPLAWMLEETHKRGIEFHAWLNPYRVSIKEVSEDYTKTDLINELDDKNFAKLNPELVIKGNDNKLILNPGEPKVREFIVDTIEELIKNYDVDAIHFDDYFYPYSGLEDEEDLQSFEAFNPTGLSKDDWRRHNVTLVIREIKTEIKQYNNQNNKAVQFGVSPFGIWANKSNHSQGSNTAGNQSYYSQYADTRLWVKEEYIDYIAPQLYWEFEKNGAGYADLVDWWVQAVKGTKVNLYIGQGLYRYNSSPTWENEQELPNQLRYNQKFTEVKGTILFSYRHLVEASSLPLIEGRTVIKNEFWNQEVLLPAVPNVRNKEPENINQFNLTYTDGYMKLSWKNNSNAKLFVVYRFLNDEPIDLNSSNNIIQVVHNRYNTEEDMIIYEDHQVEVGNVYKYFVSAVDYANNESMQESKGINLVEKDGLKIKIVIFSIISILSIGIISYSGAKVLKK
jgi:uncharacterized lipoprotein YddW (UPF0748 family)